MKTRDFSIAAILFSMVVIGVLSWLLYGKENQADGALREVLPAVNACLNSLSAFFLIKGFLDIRNQKVESHKKWMSLALVTSAAFFVVYLIHHSLHGDSPFEGEGLVRGMYFFILASHVILSIFALPLVLITYFLGFTERIVLHKKLVRFTFPIWLYVSVTGVTIYLLLKGFS